MHREAVQESHTQALVFAIITVNNPKNNPDSIVFRNFTIDFFVMARQTAYRYVHVRPEIMDSPAIEIPEGLKRWVSNRQWSAVYDLAVIRSMPDLSELSLSTVDEPAGPVVLLEAFVDRIKRRIFLLLGADGKVQAYVGDEAGTREELSGAWENPESGRHIWLSELILQIVARLEQADPAACYGTHYAGLADDKARLVAEVRAMEERYGDRARLRRNGNQIYWEYAVGQSGRQFPIHILYPSNYPINPPEIVSLKRLPFSPHQLSNNRICWIDIYNSFSDWNPSRDTAVIAVNTAHRWFACLLIYLTLGSWPKEADD